MPKAKTNQKQASEKTDAKKTAQAPAIAPGKKSAPQKGKDAPNVSAPIAAPVVAPVAEKAPQKALPVPVAAPVPAKEAPAIPAAALKAARSAPAGVLREVIVGRGPEGLYVGKATDALEAYKQATLKARGVNIVKAINALEMLRRDLKGLKVSIESRTETFIGRRQDVAKVSAVSIIIKA